MLSNMRRAFLAVVFSAIAGVGSLAWADHGHGGGHGNVGRRRMERTVAGHVSYGHFGGYGGFNNYWGGGSRFYSGYRNYGWPYSYYRNNFYRPYVYGYFGLSIPLRLLQLSHRLLWLPELLLQLSERLLCERRRRLLWRCSAAQEYVVSRPVSDVARVEIRLPDPQGTLWVQGQEINSAGTVRKFRSPQLDPSQQYTYTVKAEWNDNGKLVTDERQVKVQANALAVVDFNPPTQAVRCPTASAARPPAAATSANG